MEIPQKILSILETWCAKTGLAVNPKKTKVIVFMKLYSCKENFCLTLNEESWQLSNETKYLGVTLGGKLS